MTNLPEELFYTTPDMQDPVQPEVELTNIDLTEEFQGSVNNADLISLYNQHVAENTKKL
jgi:hypothetical protein